MGFQVNKGSSDLFSDMVRNCPANDVLERIEKIVNWKRVRKLLAKSYSDSKEGMAGYDPVILTKMLLLQNIYDLSDVRTSRECADRLSFRAFLGLDLHERVPDDSTLVRFRSRLREHKLHEKLQELIFQMIEGHGVSVKGGAMIDATLIPAATRPPSRRGTESEENEVADEETDEKPRQYKESEANHTVKRGLYLFGWKLHLARDLESGIVKSFEVTQASVHDTNVFEQLLVGTELLVLADKGYDSDARREWLREMGIRDGIMKKGRRGKEWLNEIWKEFNQFISRHRSAVENTFANLKRWRGLSRARFLGLERMREQATWSIMAHNLMIAAKY